MRILLITFLIGITSCSESVMNNKVPIQALDDYIRFRTQNGRYSGVTSIYKKDKKVFEYIGGLASRSWNIPNTSETKFNLASATKMFTAVGIGILADRGLIDWNSPIIQYYPDFPNKALAKEITIKQLLTHTSGLSDFFFEKEYLLTDKYRLRELEDYDQFYQKIKRGVDASNPFQYSNTNFVLLGRVIEMVSGTSYYEFIKKEVFDVAGMLTAGFYESDKIAPQLAEGYSNDPQASLEFGVPNDGEVRRNTFMRAVRGMPAGGAYATTADMHAFFQSLHSGQLLKNETFHEMINHNLGGYGMGFQSYSQNDIKVYGHSGGFYGVSTMVFYLPKLEYTFVSLCNSDFAAQPIFDRFINQLAGRSFYEPIFLPKEEIKTFEGFFEVTEGEMLGKQVEIEAFSDRLFFDKNLEFFPIGSNQFFDIDNDQFTLSFEKNQKGKIIGFTRTDNQSFFQKAKKISQEQVNILMPIRLKEEVLQKYLGDFQFGNEGMMPGHRPAIEIDQGALLIDNMMRFLPYEMDKFFLEDDHGMKLHYRRNQEGAIVGFKVLQGQQEVGFVKKLN